MHFTRTRAAIYLAATQRLRFNVRMHGFSMDLFVPTLRVNIELSIPDRLRVDTMRSLDDINRRDEHLRSIGISVFRLPRNSTDVLARLALKHLEQAGALSDE